MQLLLLMPLLGFITGVRCMSEPVMDPNYNVLNKIWNKTEPMLQLINNTYQRMLDLPSPDADENATRVDLFKSFIGDASKLLGLPNPLEPDMNEHRTYQYETPFYGHEHDHSYEHDHYHGHNHSHDHHHGHNHSHYDAHHHDHDAPHHDYGHNHEYHHGHSHEHAHHHNHNQDHDHYHGHDHHHNHSHDHYHDHSHDHDHHHAHSHDHDHHHGYSHDHDRHQEKEKGGFDFNQIFNGFSVSGESETSSREEAEKKEAGRFDDISELFSGLFSGRSETNSHEEAEKKEDDGLRFDFSGLLSNLFGPESPEKKSRKQSGKKELGKKKQVSSNINSDQQMTNSFGGKSQKTGQKKEGGLDLTNSLSSAAKAAEDGWFSGGSKGENTKNPRSQFSGGRSLFGGGRWETLNDDRKNGKKKKGGIGAGKKKHDSDNQEDVAGFGLEHRPIMDRMIGRKGTKSIDGVSKDKPPPPPPQLPSTGTMSKHDKPGSRNGRPADRGKPKKPPSGNRATSRRGGGGKPRKNENGGRTLGRGGRGKPSSQRKRPGRFNGGGTRKRQNGGGKGNAVANSGGENNGAAGHRSVSDM